LNLHWKLICVQGEPVSIDHPIIKKFTRKCPPASQLNPDPPRVFQTDIVTSNLDKELLPLVMNSCALSLPLPLTRLTYHKACSKLCDISSDLSSLPLTMFKLKNRHWWNKRAKYHRIEYVIKVALGAADIRFELWHDGQKLSKDNPIKVEWFTAEPPPQGFQQNRFNAWQEPTLKMT